MAATVVAAVAPAGTVTVLVSSCVSWTSLYTRVGS